MQRGGRHEAPGVGEGARARSTVGDGGLRHPLPPPTAAAATAPQRGEDADRDVKSRVNMS